MMYDYEYKKLFRSRLNFLLPVPIMIGETAKFLLKTPEHGFKEVRYDEIPFGVNVVSWRRFDDSIEVKLELI